MQFETRKYYFYYLRLCHSRGLNLLRLGICRLRQLTVHEEYGIILLWGLRRDLFLPLIGNRHLYNYKRGLSHANR